MKIHKGYIYSLLTLCFMGLYEIHAMHDAHPRSIEKASETYEWAYIVSKKCGWCNVDDPIIPQLKIELQDYGTPANLPLYCESFEYKRPYCSHSSIGPFVSLYSRLIATKEESDESFYKGYLNKNMRVHYSLSNNKNLEVRYCLFMGRSFLKKAMPYNSKVSEKLSEFVSLLTNKKFNIPQVLYDQSDALLCHVLKADEDYAVYEEMNQKSDLFEDVSYDESIHAISYDGRCVIAHYEKSLFVCDSKDSIVFLKGYDGAVKHALLSKNNKIIVAVSDAPANNCIVWDKATGIIKRNISTDMADISIAALNDNGTMVALVSKAHNKIALYKTGSGLMIASGNGEIPQLKSLRFALQDFFLVGESDGQAGSCWLIWKLDGINKSMVPLYRFREISAVAFNSQATELVCASRPLSQEVYADFSTLYLLSPFSKDKILERISVKGIVRAVAFDQRNKIIVFAAERPGKMVFSSWNYLKNAIKKFFVIHSDGDASQKRYASILFNDKYSKILLGANNAFVAANWD